MDELRPFIEQPGGTVVELGSRDGHDAAKMAEMFDASRVITIEANPHCYESIQRTYPGFENYHCAIAHVTGEASFYAVRSNFPAPNIGQSSIMYRDIYDAMADTITVPAWTMDDFVTAHNIDSIDVMKIDVEGATWQVLEGFSKIRMTRLLHIECEHKEYWPGQKLYNDISAYLQKIGYEQVYFQYAYVEQSDSIWRRKDIDGVQLLGSDNS